MQPTFYEFFAGGGMARAGLRSAWRCLFANDIDPKKAQAYKAAWGDAEFCLGDIHRLKPTDLPEHADLAWASFPCQDLSLAGNGRGLDGDRSAAFWGFHDLVATMKGCGRAPRILVLENVGGAVTSKNGRDFEMLCHALRNLGYVFGALILDAIHFVPQSRPRLFLVALRDELERFAPPASDAPSLYWTTPALRRSVSWLRPDLRAAWRWWCLPPPPRRKTGLAQLILDNPTDVSWHRRSDTDRLLAMMSPLNRRKVDAAKSQGRRVIGTIYKRMRYDENGRKLQRAEVRFDDVSGCLRTPAGGSSRQTVIVVDGKTVRTRLMSTREAARLMGLPDSYRLPSNYNDAYHLIGDGVVVPVVRFLAENLLVRLLAPSAIRQRLQRRPERG